MILLGAPSQRSCFNSSVTGCVCDYFGVTPVYPDICLTCCIAKVGREGGGGLGQLLRQSKQFHQQNRERGYRLRVLILGLVA